MSECGESAMNQSYIGTPNGVVVCVDSVSDFCFQGLVYHGYRKSGKQFGSADELVFYMQDLFDRINFPYPGNTIRSFVAGNGKKNVSQKENREAVRSNRMIKKGGPERIMTDKELLSKHGDIGTFIVRVQQRQNSTWQGRITWTEENQTLCFRSIWEMIHLIESAITSDEAKGVQIKLQEWE